MKSEHQEPTTTELKDYSKSNKTYIILVSANRCYICKYSVYSPYDLKSCFRIASASTCLELSSATAFASFRSAGFSFRKHNSRTSPLCNFIMEVFDAAQLIEPIPDVKPVMKKPSCQALAKLPGTSDLLPTETKSGSCAASTHPTVVTIQHVMQTSSIGFDGFTRSLHQHRNFETLIIPSSSIMNVIIIERC